MSWAEVRKITDHFDDSIYLVASSSFVYWNKGKAKTFTTSGTDWQTIDSVKFKINDLPGSALLDIYNKIVPNDTMAGYFRVVLYRNGSIDTTFDYAGSSGTFSASNSYSVTASKYIDLTKNDEWEVQLQFKRVQSTGTFIVTSSLNPKICGIPVLSKQNTIEVVTD